MKRVLLLVALTFTSLLASAQEPIKLFSIDENSRIVTDSRFLKSRYDNSVDTMSISPVTTFSTKVGESRYVITLSSYDLSKRYDEGGDFGVITVRRDGKVVYEYRTDDWLLKFNNKFGNAALSAQTVDDLFIEVDLSPTSKALIFDAYGFSEKPPLTILLLTDRGVRVVHNQLMGMVSVDKSDSKFSMELQSNIQESPSEEFPFNPPTLHDIWAEDGMLLFQDRHVELPMWGAWICESVVPNTYFRLCIAQHGDKIVGDYSSPRRASETLYLRKLRTISGVVSDSVAHITIKNTIDPYALPMRAELSYINEDYMSFKLLDKMMGSAYGIPRSALLRRVRVSDYYARNLSDVPLDGRWVRLSIDKDGDTVRRVDFGTDEYYVDFDFESRVLDYFSGHESQEFDIVSATSDLYGNNYEITTNAYGDMVYYRIKMLSDTLIELRDSHNNPKLLLTSTPDSYRRVLEDHWW